MTTLQLWGLDEEPNLSPRDTIVRDGPTLYVEIGFDPAFEPTSATGPNLPTSQWPALVDTGALESCIDSTLAEQLGLPIVDRQLVAGAHGAAEVNFHFAQIHVPAFGYTVYGTFAGVHLARGGLKHRALLGRTFLTDFTMMYAGRAGVVTLSDDYA